MQWQQNGNGRTRAEVPGIIRVCSDHIELLCWPDRHVIGEIRLGGVLRLWDRRCKKFVLFKVEEILDQLEQSKESRGVGTADYPQSKPA